MVFPYVDSPSTLGPTVVSTHGQPEWFRDHYRIDFDFLLELFEFMLENLDFMLENHIFST